MDKELISLSKRKQRKAREADYKKALEELGEVRSQLDDTYNRFNTVTDSAALEACIYEISALKSKYNYAVRAIKSFYL